MRILAKDASTPISDILRGQYNLAEEVIANIKEGPELMEQYQMEEEMRKKNVVDNRNKEKRKYESSDGEDSEGIYLLCNICLISIRATK